MALQCQKNHKRSTTHIVREVALFGIGLVFILSGCDERDAPAVNEPPRLSGFANPKVKNKAGEDANLSADELHAKHLAKIKEMQEKAEKAQEEKIKKLKDHKEKPEKNDGPAPVGTALSKGNAKVLEPEKPKKGDAKKNSLDIVKADQSGGHNFVEITAPNQAKHKNKDGTVNANPALAPESVIGNNEVPAVGLREPPKRSLFDRMTGRNKPPAPAIRAAGKDEQFKLDSQYKKKNDPATGDISRFVPSSPERRDTLSNRLQEIMAAKRLEKETKTQEKEEAAADKKAEVVNLEPAKPVVAETVPEGTLAPEVKATNQADIEKAQTEEEIKAAAEDQYRTGLTSRDVVAREASYQRAALERRQDALPYLLEELRQNNVLSSYAAQCIGSIGFTNEEIEVTLVRGLGYKDAQVRQSCGEALGWLRCRRATQPLLEVLKFEKSYTARSAYIDSLGLIGERAAIPALKAKMEQGDEIEIVKSRAALALARLGDPSGRAHLIRNIDSKIPALTVLGLVGLAQLNEPGMAGYLNGALESNDDEVWTTAVQLFPRLGPPVALPILRERLNSNSEKMRIRASLAMGFLGSDEAVMYIDRAARVGSLQERAMAVELLANLGRNEKVPLLIEKLQDPHTNIRQLAAISLTRLNAREALPALVEASRGLRGNSDLPPALRGAGPDPMERLIILSCIRILRGEKDDLVMTTLPNSHDNSWPELDRVVNDQQIELVKLYQLVEVIGDGKQPLGAVIKAPDGKEVMYKPGEPIAAGFKLRDMSAAQVGKDKTKLPPYVILMRGDERVTLVAGKPAEVENIRKKQK